MALLLCGCVLVVTAETTPTFYVSPTGDDAHSGTSAASPFRSVERARNAARAVLAAGSCGAAVLLEADATHSLNRTLALSRADSGRPGCPVSWGTFGGNGGRAVLSGGVAIGGAAGGPRLG